MAHVVGRWAAALTPRSRRDYARIGLVAALLAGVLLATTATAYQSTRLLSGDQSAWLHKGRTIAQINGPSGRYEATAADQPVPVAATATDPLQIVQGANGQVYTVDPRTKRVFRLDLGTMTPQPGPPGTAIVASGDHVFILDALHRTLTPVDPKTLAPGRAIRLPGPVASSAITPDGTVYLGGQTGEVFVVRHGRVTTSSLTAHQDPVEVSAVGGDPVAVVPATGGLYNLGSSHPVAVPLPGNPAAPVAVAPSQPAGPVWMVRGDLLVGADVGTGQVQQVTLPVGDSYEPPVVNAGKVYVPDTTAGTLLVFAAATLAPQPAVSVPAGAPGDHTIEAIVKDGDVWVDSPTSQDGKLLAPSGAVTTIDKGTGDGVVNPDAPPAATTPTPSPTPGPASSATPPVASPSGPTLATPASPSSVTVPGPVVPVTPTATPAPVVVTPAVTPALPSTPTPPPAVTPPPTPPPSAAKVTVPSVSGQDTTTACAAVTAAGLSCNPTITYVATAAPSGKPNIVVATTPAGGASVTKGSSVQLSVDDLAVPASSGGEQYAAYCQTVNSDAFACHPVAGGQGPAGTAPGTVASVSPGPGTLEPAGTTVTVSYYTSAATPMATVPNCSGQSQASCQASLSAAGLALSAAQGDTAEAIACGTAWQQDHAAGSSVPAGSTITVTFESVCSHPLYEYQYTGAVSGDHAHDFVHYLSFSSTPPGTAANWNQTAGADAYQPVGGTCGTAAKAGSQPLWEWTDKDSTGFDHYYFNDITPGPPGWTEVGVIACIFPRLAGQPAGSATPVYANYLGNPQNVPTTSYYNVPTADDDWTAGGGGGTSYLAWYQPTA